MSETNPYNNSREGRNKNKYFSRYSKDNTILAIFSIFALVLYMGFFNLVDFNEETIANIQKFESSTFFSIRMVSGIISMIGLVVSALTFSNCKSKNEKRSKINLMICAFCILIMCINRIV